MKITAGALALCLALLAWLPASFAVAAIADYEFGKSRKELEDKAAEIRAAAGHPRARRKAAREMASILAGPAGLEAKRFACRQLSLIGEEEEVPVLAGLLADPNLSDMARFALERNPAPAARAALRTALPTLTDGPLVGAINSLGQLRDSGAIDALAAILADGEEKARLAAAAALGRIGGDRAAAALNAARAQASPELAAVIEDAYLACGDHLLARGDKAALDIYREIFDRPGPAPARTAALRGLVDIEGAACLPLVLDILEEQASELYPAALRSLTEMDLSGRADSLRKALVRMTPEIRSLYLGALGGRNDSAGRAAAVAATEDEDERVRKAALLALGSLGDSGAVPLLTAAAARSEGDEREAAREALDSLRGESVNAALLDRLSSQELAVRREAIRSLAARNAVEALPALIGALAAAEPDIQVESAKALGEMALIGGLKPLIATLLETPSERVRSAVRESLDAICRKDEQGRECSPALVGALEGARILARCELLMVLPAAGDAACLTAARGFLRDSSTLVQESAVRALGKWPDPEPAPDLLAIARGQANERLKIMALRGYIRLAGLASDRPDRETAEMYSNAFAAAARPDESRLILAALGERPKPFSLELSIPRLRDPELKDEAVAAIRAVSLKLQYSDPESCRDALRRAGKACEDRQKQDEIRAALRALKMHSKYIALWQICGSYQEPSVDKDRLLALEFGPEKGEDADWWDFYPDPESERPWRIDLAEEIGDEDAVAYLRSRIYVPEARRVRLELGSDDGVKAWINGEMIHENNVTRNLVDRQDRLKVDLREGWNDIMLKVSQGSGDWGVSARLCRGLGRRIPGLKVAIAPRSGSE